MTLTEINALIEHLERERDKAVEYCDNQRKEYNRSLDVVATLRARLIALYGERSQELAK